VHPYSIQVRHDHRYARINEAVQYSYPLQPHPAPGTHSRRHNPEYQACFEARM
jgi:hypothetical protein